MKVIKRDNLKWSSAWTFVDKVYMPGTNKYRDNYDRIFGKAKLDKEENRRVPINSEVPIFPESYDEFENLGIGVKPQCPLLKERVDYGFEIDAHKVNDADKEKVREKKDSQEG